MGKIVSTAQNKKLFLEKLEERLGIIVSACRDIGISRPTYYSWLQKDKKFAEKVKEIEEKQIDFVEHQLLKNIQSGDVASILFYLKTKGKHRGYIERTEITGKDGESLIPHKPMNLKEAKEFLAKIESEI